MEKGFNLGLEIGVLPFVFPNFYHMYVLYLFWQKKMIKHLKTTPKDDFASKWHVKHLFTGWNTQQWMNPLDAFVWADNKYFSKWFILVKSWFSKYVENSDQDVLKGNVHLTRFD